MLGRKWVSRALLPVALATSMLATGPVPAVLAAPAAGAAGAVPVKVGRGPAQPDAREVTLITGDRFTVSANGEVAVATKGARAGVRFTSFQRDGHTYVVPSDAQRLIAKGLVDEGLFDVTSLLDYGYDSKHGELPVIVTGAGSAARAGAAAARDLPAVRGFAARAKHGDRGKLWRDLTAGGALGAGGKVWLDRKVKVSLDQSVPQVNAPIAHAGGFDGTGVTVAVLDTGIDTTHPDLVGKVAASANFTTEPDARDFFGHGTHVASTIAGSGAASGGLLRGVAPGATLLNGKVCIADGTCATSAIIAGMQWAAQQGAKVVNMSLSGGDGPDIDPMEQAVADLTTQFGTLFVCAAGNFGSDFSVGSPASANAAVAVGAVDGSGNLASFSSRGPRVGDTALKPDITGPGVGIDAARSSTGRLGNAGDSYVSLDGTSMATPHVAGGAAILTQRQPTWSPALKKTVLMNAATPNTTLGAFAQGAGLLDVGRAINQFVTTSPASVSLGRQQWPHEDDPVLTRTITYQNQSTTNGAGLTLTLNARDPFGNPAPAGMFTLSATSLSLAPGASGTVTLTVDTRIDAPTGFFGGHIGATGQAGGVSVVTPFAVDRGSEGYELTLRNTSRAGDPNHTNWVFTAARADGPGFIGWGGTAGPATIFVPKGTYIGVGLIFEGDDVTYLSVPKLVMDQPRTLDLDARVAGLVSVSVPDATVQTVVRDIGSQLTINNETEVHTLFGVGSVGNWFTGQVGVTGSTAGYISRIGVQKARPGAAGDFRNSPVFYPLVWYTSGSMPPGLTRNLSMGGFATITAAHARHVTGGVGAKQVLSQPLGDFYNGGATAQVSFDLPFTRTERYNSDGVARFFAEFIERDSTGADVVTTNSAPTQFFGGTTVSQQWNKPVFGPSVKSTMQPITWFTRAGNLMTILPPLLGDGSGFSGFPASSTVTSGQVELLRNGVQIATSGYPFGLQVEVPQATATYQVNASMTRGGPVTLSTQVSATWTFTSAFIDATTFRRLPVWAVSFNPTLNANNVAPKNTSFSMPITIAAQPNSPVNGLQSVTVQYSTNDGATWQNATVSGSGTSRTVTIPHPNITGFVSLRATASDFSGSSVTQTVIRAYGIG